MRICEPRWIRPRILKAGQAFSLVIGEAAAAPRGDVWLERGQRTCAATITSIRQSSAVDGAKVTVATCSLPPEVSPGLWDVAVRIGRRTLRMPNAVQVIERFAEAFTFIHSSDIHIWNRNGQGLVEDRSPLVERMVASINAAAPAFVIDTGDLISRYGLNPSDVFGPAEVERQMRMVREMLLKLRMPLFVTPGNHDMAFTWCRESWARHMGMPWASDTDDYSFEYGPCHFAVLDARREYDRTTLKATNRTFTEKQIEWLKRDLASTDARMRRIVCCHYDYRRQLAPLVDELRIDAVLYGHSNQSTFEADPCERASFIDAGLRDSEAYQFVHVERHGVQVTPGPSWQSLRR